MAMFSQPQVCHRSFHLLFSKAFLTRALALSSNRNDGRPKVSTSSLLKNLRRQSLERDDKYKAERNEDVMRTEDLASFESYPKLDPLPGIEMSLKEEQEVISTNKSLKFSPKQPQRRVISDPSFEATEGEIQAKDKIELRPKWLGGEYFEESELQSGNVRQNRVLRELQEEKAKEKLSSVISSDLVNSLKQFKEFGKDNGKNILEDSIHAAQLQRQKARTLKATMTTSGGQVESVSKKSEQEWVERSLEDIEETVDQRTPPQTKADPELKKKIQDILSQLKVAPKQLGTPKTIVAAVENWGKSAFYQSQDIRDEYKEQTNEIAFDSTELSFEDGNRLELFKSIVDKQKTDNVKVLRSNNIFLMESDHLVELDNVNQIGVWQNSFRDDINLSDKLWQYPVDNEVCKTEEHGVSFEEHVFLEYLLDDFPKKGPVRRFMELVINGLQKNPHLTVGQKKERVSWFKDYFADFSEEELNF